MQLQSTNTPTAQHDASFLTRCEQIKERLLDVQTNDDLDELLLSLQVAQSAMVDALDDGVNLTWFKNHFQQMGRIIELFKTEQV
jgi:hypothetical protein